MERYTGRSGEGFEVLWSFFWGGDLRDGLLLGLWKKKKGQLVAS